MTRWFAGLFLSMCAAACSTTKIVSLDDDAPAGTGDASAIEAGTGAASTDAEDASTECGSPQGCVAQCVAPTGCAGDDGGATDSSSATDAGGGAMDAGIE